MKRTFTILGAFALVASLLAYAPPRKAKADTPVVSITAPTGTVFVSSFPYAATISANISHTSLKNLNVLNFSVDGTSLTGDIGNPFDNSDQCRPVAFSGTAGATCNTSDANNATITIPWSVSGPGTYSVSVSIKHGGADGVDVEDVTFTLVAVEYPAPPAVANAYINATYKSASPKKRGCVISQIANNHAQFSKYGPKGGPYDNDLVRADVDAYIASCP